MVKIVEIDKKNYKVGPEEFNVVLHNQYNNLVILDGIGTNDRVISLLKDLGKAHNIKQCLFTNPSHGGFVPINCSKSFDSIFVTGVFETNLYENFINHDIRNAKWSINNFEPELMYSTNIDCIELIQKLTPILIAPTNDNLSSIYKHSFSLENTNLSLYIPVKRYTEFCNNFYYFLDEKQLKYDNLINLCIMVKNGGAQFEDMLNKNMHLIDRWTILDTGSTDGTLDIIKKVLIGKKKGQLFQESFINFRDSRNRLLELAGDDCKFTLMLDDTYTIAGDLRGFLEEVRGDQFADSFSLYIKSDDVEYASNRVLKTHRRLKYKYKIHEVIQDENNMNVIIPIERTRIEDGRFEYMEERTMGRKELDLKFLFEELEDDPNNSRTHYYLGQTYNLLKDYDKAFNYFMERANHPNPGFKQEKIDAVFEGARLANFQLGKPWPLCEELYLRAYEMDKSRPDSLYFLGIHYFLEGDKVKAYDYFKRAFEIGYPVHCQYSLKPTLSFHFLPKFLSQLCYENENFELGEKCSQLFLEKNTPTADQYEVQMSWYKIFVNLNKMNGPNNIRVVVSRPLLVFVADGGFEPWTGSDILTKGVGGSETYIIEMARHIQRQGKYKVVVFCNCVNSSVFEEVDYIPIGGFHAFAKNTKIHTCIISRFSEYIPVAIHGKVENLYLVLHDLTPSGVIIPIHPKLKKVFCLSEWHVGHFLSIFPQFKDITVPFYYGIDVDKFNCSSSSFSFSSCENIRIEMVEKKVANKFIYSSFPNRGLLQLLQMWPKIVGKYPDASLHIYSDIDGKWVNSVEKEMMIQVRQLLNYYKGNKSNNIFNYGWVSKAELAESWNTSEYWFYPCTFKETFCLTAVEAALSKTLCITNGLAALENTVGNRGVCIIGDPVTKEWQNRAIEALFLVMANKDTRERLVEKNYEWASKMSWSNQAQRLLSEHINNGISMNESRNDIKNNIQETMNNLVINNYPSSVVPSSIVPSIVPSVVPSSIVPSAKIPPITHPNYIAKEDGLETGGMLNWTHDLPANQGARETFEKVLKHFVNFNKSLEPRVLEIGVFAGTSLIEIVKQIPNSKAIAIDKWDSYEEINIDQMKNRDILQNNEFVKSLDCLRTIKERKIEELFYKNIAVAGMQNRIEAIKGDSHAVLLEMNQKKSKFDFIYVDGSHKCLDVAIDLFLSWQLLEKGGIMAIDDYLYSLESDFDVNTLEYPYQAVNHFLEKYKKEMIVLEKGYRVFIKKIHFL